jgi:hypothetical protein
VIAPTDEAPKTLSERSTLPRKRGWLLFAAEIAVKSERSARFLSIRGGKEAYARVFQADRASSPRSTSVL